MHAPAAPAAGHNRNAALRGRAGTIDRNQALVGLKTRPGPFSRPQDAGSDLPASTYKAAAWARRAIFNKLNITRRTQAAALYVEPGHSPMP